MLRLLWSWLVIGLLFLTLLLRGYIVYANSFWFSSLNWSSKSIKHHARVTQCLWFLFNENLKTPITLLFTILKWDEAFLIVLIWQSTINIVSELEKTLQLIGAFGLGLVCSFSFQQVLFNQIVSLRIFSESLVYISTFVWNHMAGS